MIFLLFRRAKVYRYFVDKEDGSMWKERGVGDVRLMKNKEGGTYRVLMRRDQTLKICLNHYCKYYYLLSHPYCTRTALSLH